jgi:CheY-like chemotaxis protein
LLEDYGFNHEIANNGRMAIEKLKTENYDIILMDLQMPEMNGFEATKYIRTTLNSKIPIIALTADVTTADLAKCKEVGMNDYLAKPIDERLLYNKIVGNVKKAYSHTVIVPSEIKDAQIKILKCIDLTYLNSRTKSEPKLLMKMISLYLEQTPPILNAMKESLENKDWKLLQSAVHKMLPSFSIMGIGANFEKMAKRVHEYAGLQQQSPEISDLVLQLETVCLQACVELTDELNRIKTLTNE